MTMPFTLIPSRGGGAEEIYLEVAAGVTTFILAGRYFEARAKAPVRSSPEALLELGAKDGRRTAGRRGGTHPGRPACRWQRVRRRRRKIATDGYRDGRHAVDASLLTGNRFRSSSEGDAVVGAP